MSDEALLRDGHMTVLGRLPDSSNNALLCSIARVRVVYKPQSGERPLWDFPPGTLSRRERAAAVLDDLLGWGLVPTTVWRDDGPAGPGIVQRWVQGAVDLGVFPPEGVPAGWLPVVDAQTEDGPVVVAHRDDPPTTRMIVFDALANNADRKGGHLLRQGESLHGIDHGVTFHTEDKLRTVLWGRAGQPIPGDLLVGVRSVIDRLEPLGHWLEPAEVAAVRARGERLIAEGRFPLPSGHWPPLPWPLI
jgi:uncharacterized repeat protein (TIGR03843 family)